MFIKFLPLTKFYTKLQQFLKTSTGPDDASCIVWALGILFFCVHYVFTTNKMFILTYSYNNNRPHKQQGTTLTLFCPKLEHKQGISLITTINLLGRHPLSHAEPSPVWPPWTCRVRSLCEIVRSVDFLLPRYRPFHDRFRSPPARRPSDATAFVWRELHMFTRRHRREFHFVTSPVTIPEMPTFAMSFLSLHSHQTGVFYHNNNPYL